jgi:SAM-dependent methyltransferase
MENEIRDLLLRLGLSTKDSIRPYRAAVRDGADVSVLHCERSGVFLLSRTKHLSSEHYEARSDFGYWASKSRSEALLLTEADDRRRADIIRPMIKGKRWLDIGTGLGGILEHAGAAAREFAAIEPQQGPRDSLLSLGYLVYPSIDDIADGSCDFITMFHVFSHLRSPVDFLRKVGKKLAAGGRICLETPHARDALLTLYECQAFRDFNFVRERFVVHTRESLSSFMDAAGFDIEVVDGVQRYPLANHLYWLSKGKPGGHLTWPQLAEDELDRAYRDKLAAMDGTDTLMAFAIWPGIVDH